jgi:hypothetical protein
MESEEPEIKSKRAFLRTEVRGDFNIHETKYFQYAVFLQKSKIHDVVSLLNLWWAKKTCSLHEIDTACYY